VRAACRRHIEDLVGGPKRGLRWSPDEAEAAFEFYRALPHTKGSKWAGKGFELEPWQKFIVGSVLGWKRADGTRRFRYGWIEIARKNGKTTLLAPLGLFLMVCDGEPGAEVYPVATKKDQARLLYQVARRMVLRSPHLQEIVTPYRDSLVVESTFSKMEPLGADADTLDGLDPHAVLADEVHKWKSRDLYDVMDTATGARTQPLFLAITTAGRVGTETVYGQEHEFCRQMLEGKIPNDDAVFAYVATLDDGDDWQDPANFAKANPNLGVSVQTAEILAQVKKAKAQPAAAAAVKRLRLNIRTGAADAWIGYELWDRCRAEVDWSDFAGAPCTAGLDLASTTDTACLALCFPLGPGGKPPGGEGRPEGFLFRWWFWIPEEGERHLQKRLRDLLRPWADAPEKWVELTPGEVTDTDRIEARVKELAAAYDLRKLAYDPWNAQSVANHLQEEGIPIEQFPQRMKYFAAACKEFEGGVIGKRVRHDGNPVARWMVDNTVVVTDGAGNMMPARKKSLNKIDGTVAALMAMANAVAIEGSGTSYYDRHELELA
jgi:phage terminase large subunit-like protein